ncbi:DUF4960 domain-containing protein [uncultured Bacteroides sp.]|jgi:hypothetical protein|uniref:DUF4960 domain-containing protein n=1 Tax=uncultured Bacteroides sp. TaxID=162156 RepID=UPI00280B3DB8|nr:DUF4960 domain-containing protein [uncultured Bacteroides sp.]
MKPRIKRISSLLWSMVLLTALSGCGDDNRSALQLDGDTWITAFELDQYAGVIDRAGKTITVALPETYDTDAMTVTAIEVSEGAEASVKAGDVLNFSCTQMIKVTNGNTYLDYTVAIKHDEAKILSFKLNDTYSGIIDQENRNISVRVPTTTDVTNLIPTITTSEGAIVTPASGQAIDFTNPVDFIVSYNTASAVYTVTVIPSDAPDAVYVGLAAQMDDLNTEEKAAATWMLGNIPNSQYISFTDVQAGRVDLSKCKLMWWHLHIDGGIDNMEKFENAAPAAVDALVQMKELYNNGMNLLLTRYATFYAAKLGATKDGNVPNNCWGQAEETGEIATGAWNFFIQGHTEHPIYQGISQDDKVYTFDTGYRTTNSTAQWHIGSDWGGYADNETWRSNHGGTDLGYGGDGAIVVWEYPSEGTEGGIVCIGSGCYDWYSYGVDVSGDQYHGNVAKMTENAIDYLTGK